MITIAKINPDNLDYLYKHSSQEYFSESDNEKGYFVGKLCDWQKLSGKEADKKTYDRLMSYNKEFKGVEIDPSPSKDWSILFNRVDDEEREKLSKVWDKAMLSVAKAIEQNTYYRETTNGKTEYKLAKAVSMAIFNHHTARPVNGYVDPQEHSHIVVFPQVMGQDNKFHSHTLMDLKYEKNNHETSRYFDSIMNHDLAKGLRKMGYAVKPSKHGFEIEGITQQIRNEFSKRTKQIESEVGQEASYGDKKKASLKIREKKSENNLTECRSTWRDRMDELGFHSIKKSKQDDFSKPLSELIGDKLVLSNRELKTLAYQQATFSNKTFKEVHDGFKLDAKLVKISTHKSIYKKNKAAAKLVQSVQRSRASSLAPSPLKSQPGTGTPTPLAPLPASGGQTVEECVSDLKRLEQQLSGLKLDDPQRFRLIAQMGAIKEKMNNLQKSAAPSLEKQIKALEESFNISIVADKQHLGNDEQNKIALIHQATHQKLAIEIISNRNNIQINRQAIR